jgi:aryl-alcohol dehydrogenase-like predicted oxidoreductase
MQTHDRSPLEACVSYALSFPEIDKVVIGVESAEQLQSIVDASSVSPPPFSRSVVSSDTELLDPLVWMRK